MTTDALDMRLAFVALIAVAACGVSFRGVASECRPVSAKLPDTATESRLTLEVDSLATLPANQAIAGGAMVAPAGAGFPVIALSNDVGKSWQMIPFSIPGHGVAVVQTTDLRHVWGLVTEQVEGGDVPRAVLQSDDGGESWCMQSMRVEHPTDSVPWVTRFEMLDKSNGILALGDASGTSGVYSTADAGSNWKTVWVRQTLDSPEIERDFLYPDADETLPHAPLRKLQHGYYRVEGLLRLRATDARIVAERFEYTGSSSWIRLGEIPRHFRIDDKRLVAVD